MPEAAHQRAGVPVHTMEETTGASGAREGGRLHPEAGQAPKGETTDDALGFSIPLTPAEVREAVLRRATKKAKTRRGHVPDNERHFSNTAEIVWHRNGGATIVWEE